MAVLETVGQRFCVWEAMRVKGTNGSNRIGVGWHLAPNLADERGKIKHMATPTPENCVYRTFVRHPFLNYCCSNDQLGFFGYLAVVFALGCFCPKLTRSSSNADMSLNSKDEILAARSSSFTKRRSIFVRALIFLVKRPLPLLLAVDDEGEKAAAEPWT